jgi:hypothetical protein
VPRLAVILLLLALAPAWAQTPPPPKVSGYRVTTEGGVEGTRTYRYDDQGRPIDAPPRSDRAGTEAPSRSQDLRRASPGPAAAATPLPEAPRGMTTADGRPLPFQVTGASGKSVDGSVDADSALRDFGRPSDLLERRYPTQMAELSVDPRFSTTRTMTLDMWNTRFSGLGSRRSDIVLADTLGAEVRAKDTVDIRATERPVSPWSRAMTEPENWEDRVGEAWDAGGRRVAREELSTMGTRAVSGESRRLEQLSMQDINRYQFRRARSDQPGLPVVNPGSEGVRSTRQTP